MYINIYEKYKIRIITQSNLLSEENETIYDNIFNKSTDIQEIVFDGGVLLNIISSKLADNYLSEFTVVGDEIHFEFFNYNNGESESLCYKILEGNVK